MQDKKRKYSVLPVILIVLMVCSFSISDIFAAPEAFNYKITNEVKAVDLKSEYLVDPLGLESGILGFLGQYILTSS